MKLQSGFVQVAIVLVTAATLTAIAGYSLLSHRSSGTNDTGNVLPTSLPTLSPTPTTKPKITSVPVKRVITPSPSYISVLFRIHKDGAPILDDSIELFV